MKRTAAVIVAALLLTGCGSAQQQSIAEQARSGDRKGYVSGDGTVSQIPPKDRRLPLELSGTTLEGQSWSLQQDRGKVVVLNVWGSWCGPCVKEAPELQKAWRTFQSRKAAVVFMGMDFKEGPEAGRAFEKANGITYPSLAYDDGQPVLGLGGQAPAVPTTLVLDRQGRIAGRILGATTAATLTGLVEDVLAESTR